MSSNIYGKYTDCVMKRRYLQNSRRSQIRPNMAAAIVHEVLGSLGKPLYSDTCILMESHFGHDFYRELVYTMV